MNFRYLILIILVLVSISCSNNKSQDNSSKDVGLKVSSDTLLTIYDVEKDSILIGSARAIALGTEGDIYVLDNKSNKVFRFDSIGAFKMQYIYNSGRGPGEINKPNSLFVDENSYLYLTDRDKRKFFVFNERGELFAEKKIDLMPSKISAFDTSKVFITGFRFTFQDSNIVQTYELKNSEYIKQGSFGIRTPVENELMVNMSGYSDFIDVVEKRIILNRFYPYHFEVYDENLILIHQERKEHSQFTAPFREDGLINFKSVGREILILKDWVLVRYLIEGKSYFDFYNKDFELIRTNSAEELGMKGGGKYFASYSKKNQVLVIYEDPLFNVMRYGFEKNN